MQSNGNGSASGHELIEGLPVRMWRKTLIVPPMSIGATKRTLADRKLLNDDAVSGEDKLSAGVRVVHASLIRNYPELTLEEVEELLTLGNLERVMNECSEAWKFDPDGTSLGKDQAESLSTSMTSAAS